MGVENIKVEAMKVVYGENVAQVEKITIRAGIVKANLAGKYFQMYANVAGVIQKHAFWFDTTGTDTAPTGLTDSTLHEVDISAGAIDTIAEIASELADAIALVTAYASAVATNNVIVVTHANNGYAPSAHDAKQPLKVTQLGFEIVEKGETEDELG